VPIAETNPNILVEKFDQEDGLIAECDALLNSESFRILHKVDISGSEYHEIKSNDTIDPVQFAKLNQKEIYECYLKSQELLSRAKKIPKNTLSATNSILLSYLEKIRNTRTFFRVLLTITKVDKAELPSVIMALKRAHEALYDSGSREEAYNVLRSFDAIEFLAPAKKYLTETSLKKVEELELTLGLKKSKKNIYEDVSGEPLLDLKLQLESQYHNLISDELRLEFEINKDKKVDPFRQSAIVKEIVDTMNIEKNSDWKVVTNTGKKAFMVEQATKSIKCPDPEVIKEDETKQSTYLQFFGLIHHELFVHVLRAVNSDYRLPDYIDAEEGIALILERLSKGGDTISPGGTKTRGILFALYDLGWNTKELIELAEGLNQYELTENGKVNAYTATISRMVRGGYFDHDSGNGAIFQKDRAYAKGIDIITDLIDNTKNADLRISTVASVLIKHLLSAKFDPDNLTHVLFLAEKNILPLEAKEIKYYFSKK
jgi:hypothetical protein